MYRRLALAGLLAATSTQAYALGLGPIKLYSGLNQPLNADVELLTDSPHDLSQLQVSLAPSAAFQQAGVRRTLLLTHLKFKVVKRSGGRAFIHISSPMPIREPFLDFVLEVDWSGGQLMREYTMLINPPTFMAHATPPASSPSPGSAAHATSRSAAPSTASPTPPTMAQAAAAAGDQVQAGQYGPTARTDTLWAIAAKVRPDHHVTMEQTMVALQRANPKAFYGGNINRLKAGYVLRVPDRAAMTSLAPLHAQQLVARQNAIWREARKTGGVERQASAQTAATASQGGRLKLVAPQQPSTSAASGASVGGTAAAGGTQTNAGGTAAAAAGGGTQTSAAGTIASLREKLNAALKSAAAQRSETAQLQAQVNQLQAKIQSMHHLLNVHSGSMAQVQGQGAAAAGATAGAVAGAPNAASSAAAQPGKSPAAPQAAKAASPAKPAGGATPNPQVAAKAAKPAVPAVPPVAKHRPPPVEAAQTPPAPRPTIWDELLANPLMDGLGGAAVLVALLLGWVSARRRRMAMTEFQESILAAEQASSGSAAATAAADAAGPDTDEAGEGAAGESSLLSDFSVSDMNAIQSEGEADPLAEADVYLAYGRYQQAEELVSEAIKEAPGRNDLHMKLLEIFHAAQNAAAFDTEAESFLALLEGPDDPLWGRVVEMGREISPDNPLYQDRSADDTTVVAPPVVTDDVAEGDAPAASESHELEAPELMADVQGSAAEDNPQVGGDADSPAGGSQLDSGLDFDLDFDMGNSAPEPAAEQEVESNGVEFTVGDDDSSAAATPEPSQTLDISSEGGSESAPDELAMPELSFDALGTEGDTGAAAAPEKSDEHASADSMMADDTGFELDLSSLPELGEDNAAGEADEGEEGLLSDVDEVGTKLDLARAYMDMGDPDGARSILEEVREEGNGDQQEEAQSLLTQLA